MAAYRLLSTARKILILIFLAADKENRVHESSAGGSDARQADWTNREQRALEHVLNAKEAQFVAVWGRRRVEKSYQSNRDSEKRTDARRNFGGNQIRKRRHFVDPT